MSDLAFAVGSIPTLTKKNYKRSSFASCVTVAGLLSRCAVFAAALMAMDRLRVCRVDVWQPRMWSVDHATSEVTMSPVGAYVAFILGREPGYFVNCLGPGTGDKELMQLWGEANKAFSFKLTDELLVLGRLQRGDLDGLLAYMALPAAQSPLNVRMLRFSYVEGVNGLVSKLDAAADLLRGHGVTTISKND